MDHDNKTMSGVTMEQTLTVGLPWAMLYYRFHVLWEVFFQELGVHTLVNLPTDRQMMAEGLRLRCRGPGIPHPGGQLRPMPQQLRNHLRLSGEEAHRLLGQPL